MLADAPPWHRCRHAPIPALFLCLMQDVQDHALLAGQPIADIRYCIEALRHGIAKSAPPLT